SRKPFKGRRHEQLRKTGDEALAEVQQRGLSGESIDGYENAEQDAAGQRWRRVFSARPHREADGTVAGVFVSVQQVRAPGSEPADAPIPDPLTGLPGRDGFTRRVQEILADLDPDRRSAALFAVNLDSFRSINNLHGVRVGDQVLKIAAERLVSGTRTRILGAETPAEQLRGRDLVARLGDDEFGIVLAGPPPGLTAGEALSARLLRL